MDTEPDFDMDADSEAIAEANNIPSALSLAVGTGVLSCLCGCGGDPCVPQWRDRRFEKGHRPQRCETILFRVDGKCGFPLRDALETDYSDFEGCDEPMFAENHNYAVTILTKVDA
ncbi:hypothetical protein BDM02DRAFT_3112111 [Thelephora ganbajun]|uniref:Uncharacterized protein n=1 Tax=Thelephora ganbajun TaxID=370292 RepID=A0ACB6ZMA5_THEGA|nr:hypothetical protein BDM02DRAFT_3112111 [Thelephora ganbajun]